MVTLKCLSDHESHDTTRCNLTMLLKLYDNNHSTKIEFTFSNIFKEIFWSVFYVRE